MEIFFEWLGFLGAWLLFAGPIYQAAIELQDEDIEVDRIRATGAKLQTPPEISSLWWVIPPIKFYKEFKRGKTIRSMIIKALSPEDVEAMVSFNSKAVAWLMVALGGFCLAARETFQLTQYYELDDLMLVFIIIGMFAISIINLVSRLKRAKNIKASS